MCFSFFIPYNNNNNNCVAPLHFSSLSFLLINSISISSICFLWKYDDDGLLISNHLNEKKILLKVKLIGQHTMTYTKFKRRDIATLFSSLSLSLAQWWFWQSLSHHKYYFFFQYTRQPVVIFDVKHVYHFWMSITFF